MNTYLFASVENTWLLAGWTMIHFLWLGTLVALVGLLSRWLLRRNAANVRYVAALTCLATLAALPIAIATWLHAYSPSVEAANRPPQNGAISQSARTEQGGVIELKNIEPPPLAIPSVTENSDTPISAQSAPRTAQPIDLTVAGSLPDTSSPAATDSLSAAIFAINFSVRYLPWLWLIGTPLTFALTATGLLGGRRLRRASRPITDGPIAEALEKLAASLRLSRRVAVAICDRIAAPVLIGIFRPIILLPPAALTGYSPDEIEMVLLHELAHVRRWDNLINLIQRLVESLLFFHPAVWLISSWVRRERESCCDALVVMRTDRPYAYAELLVALAAQMPRSVLFHPAASSAMAAGPLRSRIRRILQLDDDPMLISGKSFALVLGMLLVAATLAVLYVPSIGQAEQSATEATDGAKANSNAAAEAQTKNNLKNLSLALQNYHETRKLFSAHAIYNANGKPLLSWRVQILPFLDEPKLYQEFHLNEPWDSEHNRKLIARMPAVFKNPKLNKPGLTNYLAVVGQECVFNGSPKGLGFTYVTDGTSNTIALVEANADLAVEWTKPQDWNFDRAQPTKGLGQLWPGGWYAAWVDGSVRRVANSEPADRVGIQFTRAGGETKSLAESANRTTTELAGAEGAPGDVIDAALAGAPGGPAAGEATEFSPQAVAIEGHPKLPALEAQNRTDDWPAGVVFASPEEAEIAKRAWRQWSIKIVPTTQAERGEAASECKLKVVSTGRVPTTSLLFLNSLNNIPTTTYGQLANALGALKGIKVVLADCATETPHGFVGTRIALDGTDNPAIEESGDSNPPTAKASARFPSLEDQKQADLVWKRLKVEVTQIGPVDLKRVKALGYDGGMRLTNTDYAGKAIAQGSISDDDILVGLHAWPTRNIKEIVDILSRPDLSELSPLKFYVIRREQIGMRAVGNNEPTAIYDDVVHTGRINVNLGGDGSGVSGNTPRSDSQQSSNQTTSSSPWSMNIEGTKTASQDLFASNAQQETLTKQLESPKPKDTDAEVVQRMHNRRYVQLKLEYERAAAFVKQAADKQRESAKTNDAAARDAQHELDRRFEQAKRDFEAAKRQLEQAQERINPQLAAAENAIAAETTTKAGQPANGNDAAKAQPKTSQFVYAQIDGVIKSVKVAHGDIVHKDDVLLVLESPNLDKEMESIHRQLQQALAIVRLKTPKSDSKEKLSDVEKKEKEHELAPIKESISSYQKQLDVLGAKKAKLKIISPIDGRVATPNTHERLLERPVNRGEKLLEIASSTEDLKRDALIGTATLPKAEPVKVTLQLDPSVAKTDGTAPSSGKPTPAGGNSQVTRTPAEAVFVAYEIPSDLKDKVQQYFSRTGVRSMADDRGRYIVQASQTWHDHFGALLKATPKWRDPAATKERAATPVVMKKGDGEDILEWRSVGLSLKPNRETRLPVANQTGVAVSEIDPVDPAAWADMRLGDVLTDVGSFKAGTILEIQSLLKALGEGFQSKKTVSVSYFRLSQNGYFRSDFALGPEDLGAKQANAPGSKSAANAAGQSTAPSERLKVYFFYTPDAQPARETRPLVKTVVGAFPGVRLVEVDASQASDQARKFNIDKVPTCVLTRYGQEVSRVVGAQTQLELATAIQSALTAPVGEPIKAAEEGVIGVLNRDPKTGLFASTNPSSQGRGDAKGEKSTLRYEGKSFEGWKSAWQSELSLEKRTEAVRALAAFGSRGFGPEASEAILNVAQEYELLEHGNTPEGKFGDAVIGSLSVRIPKKDWLPLLRKRYESDPTKWQNLAIQLLTQLSSSNEKENDDIRTMLLMLAQSTNEYISSQAYDALVRHYPDNEELTKLLTKLFQNKSHWISAVRWLGWTPQYPPEVIDLLLHGDRKQQADARNTFLQIPSTPAKKALVATMIGILKDNSKSADHIAAIRALAALGAANSGFYDTEGPQLLKEIVKKGPIEKQVAAAYALQYSTRGQTQGSPLLAEYARDAEGKVLDRLATQSLISKESDVFIGK